MNNLELYPIELLVSITYHFSKNENKTKEKKKRSSAKHTYVLAPSQTEKQEKIWKQPKNTRIYTYHIMATFWRVYAPLNYLQTTFFPLSLIYFPWAERNQIRVYVIRMLHV